MPTGREIGDFSPDGNVFVPWDDREAPPETVAQFERGELTEAEFSWLSGEIDDDNDGDAAYIAKCIARKESRRGNYTGTMRKAKREPPRRVVGKLYKPSKDNSVPWDDTT